jgi:hypothetical protein
MPPFSPERECNRFLDHHRLVTPTVHCVSSAGTLTYRALINLRTKASHPACCLSPASRPARLMNVLLAIVLNKDIQLYASTELISKHCTTSLTW